MYRFQWCVSHLRFSICSLLCDYWLVSRLFFAKLFLFLCIFFCFYLSPSPCFPFSPLLLFYLFVLYFLLLFLLFTGCHFVLFIFWSFTFIHVFIPTTHGYIMNIYQPKGVITIILYSHKHVQMLGNG